MAFFALCSPVFASINLTPASPQVYPTIVSYYCDSDVWAHIFAPDGSEAVSPDGSCLTPKNFTPTAGIGTYHFVESHSGTPDTYPNILTTGGYINENAFEWVEEIGPPAPVMTDEIIETGTGEFWLVKSIDYGQIIIILLMLIFMAGFIFVWIWNFVWQDHNAKL